MATQRGKTRIVALLCVLAALSGLSFMAFAGDRSFYGGTTDYSGLAAPDGVRVSAAAAAAAYIKFDGVDGEAQDRDHRNWSDLLSFGQGQFVSVDAATGRARGRVVFEDIVVTKKLDKASPKLAEAVALGKIFPTVEIDWTWMASDGIGQTYYSYELKNVRITSYSISGSAESDTIPTESFSLNFEEIKATYTGTDESGQSKGNVEYTWKVEEGVK